MLPLWIVPYALHNPMAFVLLKNAAVVQAFAELQKDVWRPWSWLLSQTVVWMIPMILQYIYLSIYIYICFFIWQSCFYTKCCKHSGNALSYFNVLYAIARYSNPLQSSFCCTEPFPLLIWTWIQPVATMPDKVRIGGYSVPCSALVDTLILFERIFRFALWRYIPWFEAFRLFLVSVLLN